MSSSPKNKSLSVGSGEAGTNSNKNAQSVPNSQGNVTPIVQKTNNQKSFEVRAAPLTSMGIPVIPCLRKAIRGKKAKTPYTPHGFHDAATEEKIIRKWSNQWPDALVGMPTGAASGLVVLDTDNRHGVNGEDTLRDKKWETGTTHQYVTGSGGKHYLYKYAPETPLKNNAGKIGPGVDVRTNGGYAIRWDLETCEADNQGIYADIPIWLVEASKKKPANNQSADLHWDESEDFIEGARNDSLTSKAGVMRRAGCSADEIYAALIGMNYRLCNPPLEESEVRTIAKSVGRYPPAENHHLATTKGGKFISSPENLRWALTNESIRPFEIATDEFLGDILRKNDTADAWQRFADGDYTRIRIDLHHKGFAKIPNSEIKDVVHLVAEEVRFDSAINWLKSLPSWDGVERCATFLHAYMRAEDNAYHSAVSRYLWTALAGRVLTPGCKADMVPVLSGPQGAYKSTTVASIAPEPNHFIEIDLSEKDENLARKMRGKIVGELGELRGLNSKRIEEIKSFVTRQDEEWVPKFKEFSFKYPRRCVFIGTTNENDFLADATGERRWLPVSVPARTLEDKNADLAQLVKDREQLWAEARVLYGWHGVMFKEAEELARNEHEKFKHEDAWKTPIWNWLTKDSTDDFDVCVPATKPMYRELITTTDVMSEALNLEKKGQTTGVSRRVARILKELGFKEARKTVDGQKLRGFVWDICD